MPSRGCFRNVILSRQAKNLFWLAEEKQMLRYRSA
jgi:hypothetical protein